MIRVEVEVEIARPPEEVFAYITNFENNIHWQQGMRKITITSEGPLGVGSTYDQVARFLGRDIVSSFVVTEYEPNHHIRIKTTESSFPIEVIRGVEPIEGGTRVYAIIEGDSSGFFSVFERLMRWMVRRSIEGDYRRLKELLEA